MPVLIRLAAGQAEANSDTALGSGQEFLETTLSRWSIPYEYLTGVDDEDPAPEPVIIRDSFANLKFRTINIVSSIKTASFGTHLNIIVE